ncbi:MAG TPA: phosphate/phosphite/phosphonate ABC transporter substrate-binding protein [Nitrospirota bacterium]|jgi:phosphonate transport system substrate-binding protein
MRRAVAFIVAALLLCASQAGAEEKELRVAVASMLSPQQTFIEYRKIIEYLGRKTGRKAGLVQRKGYNQVDRMLKKGEIDAAFISSGPYITDQDDFGVDLLGIPVILGKSVFYSYTIVRTDSPFKSLQDLKGKNFAYTDPGSSTGCWYVLDTLHERGFDPYNFFAKTIYTYGHDNSIEAVYKGLVDGASVNSIIYDFKLAKGDKDASGTRIIEQSPGYAMPPVVASKRADPALRKALKMALLDMHKDPEGRAILALISVDRFVEAADRDYDSLRKMKKAISKISKDEKGR